MKKGGVPIGLPAGLVIFSFALALPAPAPAKDTQPNLSGTWKIDLSRSDNPQQMQGGQGHGGPPGGWHGQSEGEHGQGGPPPGGSMHGGGGRHGAMRMPESFALVQLASGIELRDSTGAVVRRVVVNAPKDLAPVDSAGVVQLRGKWDGQKLEAESAGPRGGTVHETFELIDSGNALKITTEFQPPDDRPPFTLTRVYTRSKG